MAPQAEVRRIEVKVNTQGDSLIRSLAKDFANLSKDVKKSTDILGGLQKLFFAFQGLSFAGIGVSEIVKLTDSLQKLNDRLTITEGSVEKARTQFGNITQTANANYQSIEDLATVYNRLSLSLGDTGINSEALIGLTDILVKTFRLSGSTAAEATAATIQLSQGLASGQVRGQELRSVLEQNAVVGDLLAKQFKTTRGQLLKFAEKEGGISAVEFMKALAAATGDLNTKAEKLKPTIQEALIVNFNNLKLRMKELNEQFRITEKVVSVIDVFFKNLDWVATILAMAAAYKGYTLAVSGAAAAQAVFNTTLLAITGSGITGFLVKLGVTAGALTTALAALSAAGLAFTFNMALEDKAIQENSKSLEKNLYLKKSSVAVEEQAAEAMRKAMEANKYRDSVSSDPGRNYVLLDNSINEVDKSFKELFDTMIQGKQNLSPFQKAFEEYAKTAKNAGSITFEFKKELAKLNKEQLNGLALSEYNKRLKELKIQDLTQDFKTGSIDLEQYNKRLREIQFGKLENNVKDFQFALRALNREFGKNGDISKYSEGLRQIEVERLSEDLKDGKINLIDFNRQLAEKKLEAYNSAISMGAISLERYRESTNNIKLEQLNEQFRSGKIEVAEYNAEVTKLGEKFSPGSALFTGINNYISSAGTLSQNIADGVTRTFGRLEDSMVQFTQTGKFNFREFTKAVLDDLNRIIIRSLIIRPLAQGILGAISAPSAGTAGGPQTYGGASTEYMGRPAAKGAAFDGMRANFFASGGVVSGATAFGYGGGKLGVLGEAGPEAILPLKRGANGDLGVKASPSNVVVNVINQSGAETEQRETTSPNGDRVIDIIILNKVKEGFANGAFDRQMSQQYGLRRRGA